MSDQEIKGQKLLLTVKEAAQISTQAIGSIRRVCEREIENLVTWTEKEESVSLQAGSPSQVSDLNMVGAVGIEPT